MDHAQCFSNRHIAAGRFQTACDGFLLYRLCRSERSLCPKKPTREENQRTPSEHSMLLTHSFPPTDEPRRSSSLVCRPDGSCAKLHTAGSCGAGGLATRSHRKDKCCGNHSALFDAVVVKHKDTEAQRAQRKPASDGIVRRLSFVPFVPLCLCVSPSFLIELNSYVLCFVCLLVASSPRHGWRAIVSMSLSAQTNQLSIAKVSFTCGLGPVAAESESS
jgi:hypothetical protein